VLECSRAAAELGWQAQTRLELGLEKTIQHLNEESR
jgi:nucleoside-diphosphate-sugar epimerase